MFHVSFLISLRLFCFCKKKFRKLTNKQTNKQLHFEFLIKTKKTFATNKILALSRVCESVCNSIEFALVLHFLFFFL